MTSPADLLLGYPKCPTEKNVNTMQTRQPVGTKGPGHPCRSVIFLGSALPQGKGTDFKYIAPERFSALICPARLLGTGCVISAEAKLISLCPADRWVDVGRALPGMVTGNPVNSRGCAVSVTTHPKTPAETPVKPTNSFQHMRASMSLLPQQPLHFR